MIMVFVMHARTGMSASVSVFLVPWYPGLEICLAWLGLTMSDFGCHHMGGKHLEGHIGGPAFLQLCGTLWQEFFPQNLCH
jgi:hypothetical protein